MRRQAGIGLGKGGGDPGRHRSRGNINGNRPAVRRRCVFLMAVFAVFVDDSAHFSIMSLYNELNDR